MKIESIYHSKEVRRKECKGDKPITKHSKDPIHHPMLLEREYIRALNAVKIEKMVSKPFITALSHHREGINKLSKDYNSNLFISSSYDNKMVVWDLFDKKIVFKKQYQNLINGIAVNRSEENINVLVSQLKRIELSAIRLDTNVSNNTVDNSYTIRSNNINTNNINNNLNSNINNISYQLDSTVMGLDYLNDIAVSHSTGVSIFDINRITSKISYLGEESTFIKFNRSFKYILAGLDRMNINLYDNRTNKDFMKIEQQGTNCISFNPQKGHIFACGNEDGNGYLFDIRNDSKPIEIYRGHTNAIVSIAFSPDGKEIATGSYDRTIRIFRTEDRKARDCYYNDRMQIVHGVEYSNDGDFIISGSDDGSLRLWKANSSRKMGPVNKYEKESLEYNEALKEKFKYVEEVSRISKHRFLNKEIKNEMRIKNEMYQGQLRRAAKREKQKGLEESSNESNE